LKIFESLKAGLFVVSIIASTLIFGSTVLIAYPFTFWYRNRSHLHQIGVIWARSIIFLNRSWHFHISGKENISQLGISAIYIANHVSQTDILAAFSIGMDFRWLSKASIFRIPILGWAMAASGYVPVRRGNKASHKHAMNMARKYLQSGTSMFFFPEGTRSWNGRLQKFKLGAFQLAYETGAPVIPITLQGTERLLPKGTWAPGEAEILIHVHPPVTIRAGEDIQSLANRVFEIINNYLPEHMKALQ
jgi:1-acyl-sn-glycerol-3-phosphate acyltransferase